MARVSVRALHHYDEIGLLVPSGRSTAGYRLYTDRDLERLQEILFFRELGFALEEIKRLLSDKNVDRKTLLLAQKNDLVQKASRLHSVVALIDRTLDAMTKGKAMSDQELFDGFAGPDAIARDEEAKARWGDTDSYKESARRTRLYTKDDWAAMRDESEAITQGFANLLAGGVSPQDERAIALAERARLHIDRWFYPCSPSMHVTLGEMYVQDPRFAQNYDRHAPGLAQFVCEAIRANDDSARRARF